MTEKRTMKRAPKDMVGLQLRFRETLRQRLQVAAQESGNSMNGEIGERLARSLDDDIVYGTRRNRELFAEANAQMAHAERATGKSWTDDLETFWAARDLVLEAFERSAPKAKNYDEIVSAQIELARVRKERANILAELKKLGAVRPSRRDDPSEIDISDRPYEKTPLARFEDADAEAQMDGALADILWSELADIESDLAVAKAELGRAEAHSRAARERGRAIAATISGSSETEDG
ncbi:hypothetical protein [Qipengyuania sp. 902]|uniref:hypothetical protein n=1 Tax=Qipengyuania sp. 902 TaxID=3417565 RepID=UPI003EBA74EE